MADIFRGARDAARVRAAGQGGGGAGQAQGDERHERAAQSPAADGEARAQGCRRLERG